MIKNYILSDLDFNYFMDLPEVIKAKESVLNLHNGSINFSISINDQLKEILSKNLDVDLSEKKTLPMRWIKGDTIPHKDRCVNDFEKTFIIYLTDSEGEIIIEETHFKIRKGNAFVFSQGITHGTIGTYEIPRLLIGPMSEQGIEVGTTLSYPGGTKIYMRQNLGLIEFSIDQTIWNSIGNNFPIILTNTTATTSDQLLFMLFITDIIIDNTSPGGTNKYFICGSEKIQFGSTSLNPDGSMPNIIIDGIINYPGLINNNFNDLNGFNNIYIFNLEINVLNGSNLVSDGGWIGQAYFGKGATNNYILNCSSNGPIIDGGGGILGGYSGSQLGASLYIIGCSSSGDLGTYSGGIVGFNSGEFGGQVICESCWSTGALIGPNCGGIFGYYAGNEGLVIARKCYSLGAILGQFAGGIFGQFAGNAGTAEAEYCYSQGNISEDAGGIFGGGAGSDGGSSPALSCYSSGIITTSGNGIYGTGTIDNNPQRCYVANGLWSNTVANSFLFEGIPNSVVGTIWVASGGVDYPYELNNIGFSPYNIQNIIFNGVDGIPILNQIYSQTIYSGESTIPAFQPSLSYEKLSITSGNVSSYDTITINEETGIISSTKLTIPGFYKITIRNIGSYNITLVNLIIINNNIPDVIPDVIPNIIPNSSICFIAGTPVLTDQGEISIEKIDNKKHTIRGQKIITIVESIPEDFYLICIEKNSFSYNVPNRRTIISKDHKIMCDKKLIRAEYLIQYIPTIYKIPYNKQKLYNVLLNDYSTMSVNNLIVETMNPHNSLAKIFLGNYSTKEKNELIKILNNITSIKRKKTLVSRNIVYS